MVQEKARLEASPAGLQSKSQDIKEAFFSDAPKACALLAELKGAVVGIATYCENYSTFIGQPGIWLDDVYVYPEHRNQGIGKALLACLCTVALERGCTRVDSAVAIGLESERMLPQVVGAQVFDELRHVRINEANMKKLAERSKEICFDR
jgi:GNAT superfamily N-acetyltransferase